MNVFEKLHMLMAGLFLPLFALADGPGRMGDGTWGDNMMHGLGGTGLFMTVIMILLVVLLVLVILALIKYLRHQR